MVSPIDDPIIAHSSTFSLPSISDVLEPILNQLAGGVVVPMTETMPKTGVLVMGTIPSSSLECSKFKVIMNAR